MPIHSFKCKDTQALFFGHGVAKWRTIERVALRKLAQLDWSMTLDDLRIPPGNHLEALAGKRQGQYSIRINGNGACASAGRKMARAMLKSSTTIKEGSHVYLACRFPRRNAGGRIPQTLGFEPGPSRPRNRLIEQSHGRYRCRKIAHQRRYRSAPVPLLRPE